MKVSIEDIKKVEIIKTTVSDYYKIPIEQILAKSRRRVFIVPRQMMQKLIKDNTILSLAEIGEFTGKKDHATILHACRSINGLIETDKKIMQDFQELQSKVKVLLTPDKRKSFLLKKLHLFKLIRQAPNDDFLKSSVLKYLEIEEDYTVNPKMLKDQLSKANKKIESLKAKHDPLLLEIKELPEKEKENVLLKIEAIVKYATATRLKKADLINKRISA